MWRRCTLPLSLSSSFCNWVNASHWLPKWPTSWFDIRVSAIQLKRVYKCLSLSVRQSLSLCTDVDWTCYTVDLMNVLYETSCSLLAKKKGETRHQEEKTSCSGWERATHNTLAVVFCSSLLFLLYFILLPRRTHSQCTVDRELLLSKLFHRYNVPHCSLCLSVQLLSTGKKK